ncbi:MAG: hypothetical protein AABY10_02400 [Nanoarchaeota archaeon]
MQTINLLLVFLAIILSIPVGYLIAWLCKEELLAGRNWFKLLCVLSFFSGIISLIFRNYEVFLTCVIIVIISAISLAKGYDKRWLR